MAANLEKVFQLLMPTKCLRIPCISFTRRLCLSAPSSLQSKPASSSSSSSEPSSDTPPLSTEDERSLTEDERPHMLNVVWRVRSVKRRPYWERKIIKQLMLERNDFPVVHKNIESVNILLRKVRHLVRIKPLDLKYGLPNGDYESTLLKWNGSSL